MSRTFVGEADWFLEKLEHYIRRIEAIRDLPLDRSKLSEMQQTVLRDAIRMEVDHLSRYHLNGGAPDLIE